MLDGTRIHFGGDYNPEQHPRELRSQDVALMRDAGVDLVNVGIFSWSRIQRAEGRFEFTWLDEVLGMLHDADIGVALATGTASPPPWMHERYPEILPHDEDGRVLGPGGRQHYAPSSPTYRRLAAELASAVAERYVNHPAVRMWHVNNEYGCHVSADYSDAAAAAFRAWLAERYGDVGTLNDAWGTEFWSQRYQDFAQVLPPRRTAYTRNPAQQLDFRRFGSDALLECYLLEKGILVGAGATQPITTNLIGPWPTLDLWRWAPHLDIISDDAYPEPDDPEGFREAALHSDMSRGLAGGGAWWRMEAAPVPAAWRSSAVGRAPGRVRALAWQAVGRGADGIQFFQWRQSSAGAEKFHSAMVPHTGPDSTSWREIVELGRELRDARPTAAHSGARVCLVIDYENWWALEADDLPVRVDYGDIVRRWYRALHAEHVMVDIVPAGADLTPYRLVVAPQLYLLGAAAAERIRDAVAGGAVVALGAMSDVVDETVRFRPGGFLTQLGDVFGIRVAQQFPLSPRGTATGTDTVSFSLLGAELRGDTWVDHVEPSTAEVEAVFAAGPFAGLPAVTRARHGELGEAWYLATVPEREATDAAVRLLLAAADLHPDLAGLPSDVELMRRGDLLTLINHGAPRTLAVEGIDAVTGEPVGEVDLKTFGVAHLRADDR